MTRRLAPGLAALALVLGTARAAEPEWPQFRGPNGSGVAAATAKPPVEFGPAKNVRWKVPAPPGASSPVVAGGTLFLTAFEGGKLLTLAYSTADGKELWRAEAPAKQVEKFHKTEGSPAASTVATDGTLAVAYFGSAGVFAYDFAGKELWRYELPAAKTDADFGTGVSPVLVDGLVILQRDEAKDSKLVALDAATGKPKWETKRDSRTSYGTPVVWATDAGKQLVCGGSGRLVGYDLKSGQEVWSVAGMPAASCTTPVAAGGLLYYAGWAPGDAADKDFKLPTGDEIVKQGDADKDGKISPAESENTFLKGFFESNDTDKDGFITAAEWDAIRKSMESGKNSAFALRAGGKGDVTKSHVAWRKTKGLPYVPSAILAGGQYFMVKDGGLCTAYDAATGKDVYVQERGAAQGRYYASPVLANGHVYVVTLDDGTFTVLKAGADAPEVVAKNPKLSERAFATPAVAGDALYVRTEKTLWAFAEAK